MSSQAVCAETSRYAGIDPLGDAPRRFFAGWSWAITFRMAWTAAAFGLLLGRCAAAGEDPIESGPFERGAGMVLAVRCVECHSGSDPSGGLDLSTTAGLQQGGDSGPAIMAGQAAESLVYQRVVAGEMPPESQGHSQKLPESEIATLRAWIDDGAPWPRDRVLGLYDRTTPVRGGRDWWSLQPILRPELPHVKNSQSTVEASPDTLRHPIDAWIGVRLEESGLTWAPEADRRTLVRRAYFDLLGLPPAPEDVEAFVNEDSPDAWERLVDRLLASPHYGERWARYWLDVVRFAETCGYERDQMKPGIWKYRDWVVQALNEDMPYDRFLTLQLAGDEVPDRSEATVVATGMLRAGTWNDEPNDPADYLYERLEDLVHTTSSAFLGLTVKCARCHNHKFDPIPQTDYYRLAGFFWPGYLGQANLGGPTTEELGFDVFGWTDRGAEVEPLHLLIKGNRLDPGPIVEPGFLTAVPDLDQPLDVPPAQATTTRRRLQLARWLTDPRHPLTARVLVNRIWLHHFGTGIVRSPNNFGFKGELPTHPQLLDWLAAELVKPADASQGAWSIKHLHRLIMTSRTYRQSSVHPNQTAFDDLDPQNTFYWRFPRRRLDAEALRDAMLACSGRLNLRQGGPSFAPAMSPEALEGLSKKGDAWEESSPDERARRSIYMLTKRSRLLPLMTAFDFPDTTLPCGQRDVTTVAPQALALLNNEFVHQQSRALAARVMEQAGEDPEEQVVQAWRLALGRRPDPEEQQAALTHLRAQARHFARPNTSDAQPSTNHDGPDARPAAASTAAGLDGSPQQLALASLCHVLLNSNEFLYVD